MFANPDGTFTLESNAAPVRARQDDGSWAPIDTTLTATADGHVRARSTTSRVEFSGGGSAQDMVVLTRGDKRLALDWPSPLPKPTVADDTATYSNVLPGVDLKLTAVGTGFTQVLVVNTPEAAANPALTKLKMSVKGQGVTAEPTATGGLRYVDEDGQTVFESPAGRMWDSSGDQLEPGPDATPAMRTAAYTVPASDAPAAQSDTQPDDGGSEDPADAPTPGDKTAEVSVHVSGQRLELTPDPALLRDKEAVFPLYIDPPVKGLTPADWTALSSDGDAFWEFSGEKGVGYCANYAGYLCSYDNYTQRIYYEYPLSSLYGKKILDATFEVFQTWSFTCSQHNYWLVRADEDRGISSSTRFSTKPAYVDLMGDKWSAMGRGTLCDPAQPADWLRFSDNVSGGEKDENLTPTLQSMADGQKPHITLELRAQDESTTAAWARFRNDAKLSVTYISKPGAPDPVGVQNGSMGRVCNPSATPLVTSDTTPEAVAYVQSPDGAQSQLRAVMEVWKTDGSQPVWTKTSGPWVADNMKQAEPTSTLSAQTTYKMRAKTQAYYSTDRGATGVLDSPWSTWCYFRVDTDSPPRPTIKSADGLYLPADSNPASGGVGVPGKFTFTPGDTNSSQSGIQSDVTSYRWRLNSGTVSTPISVSVGASYTKTITPNQAGENTIQVWAYDDAGHISQTGYYSFNVKGAELPAGVWSLDGNGDDTTTASTKHPLTLGSESEWSYRERAGTRALWLKGEPAQYARTDTPPVDTSKSYTVSAWARLSNGVSSNQTVLGMNGDVYSAFYLSYEHAKKTWTLRTSPSDSTGGNLTQQTVVADQPAVTNAWTHLSAVYDAADQEIRLYVNGRLQGSDDVAPSWKASGGLQVGRVLWGGGNVDHFVGSIDEVKVWKRALAGDEIAQDARLEDEDASDNTAGDPIVAEVGGWDAVHDSGTILEDTTGFGRDMALKGATLGADPSIDPATGEIPRQVMALNGSSSYATAPGPIVDETGSFTATVWTRLDSQKLKDTSKSYRVQVMGQAGDTHSSWGVWYDQPSGSTVGKWRLGRPTKDSGDPIWITADSGAAKKDMWVRLTAVYDAQQPVKDDDGDGYHRGAMFLYVDTAQLNGNGAAYASPWQGLGAFEAGRGLVNGTTQRYFPGHIASIRIWAGAMSGSDIAVMFGDEAGENGR
ncbi:LamG-like jellyroll fold domain-containing protein [Streptomyces sp. NPDC101132]|uniref:LamG domain-containing protein n=1 Tax=Streptomyces sp. NPDC101132 TaxID=3366110 RepID=UPI0037F45634